MKRIGIEATYRRPNTSKLPLPSRQASCHPAQSGLPQGYETYTPMKRGFVYLAAVIDWFIRRVL